jgi:hypothetical protein
MYIDDNEWQFNERERKLKNFALYLCVGIIVIQIFFLSWYKGQLKNCKNAVEKIQIQRMG